MNLRESLEITPLQRSDVNDLFGLIKELADFEKLELTTSASQLETSLFDGEFCPRVLMARLDAEPVGYAVFFYSFSTFLGRPSLYLEDIYVKQDHRRKGFGRKIFSEVVEIARAENLCRIDWTVLDWNIGAQEMYKKIGAKHIEDWFVYRLEEKGFEKILRTQS